MSKLDSPEFRQYILEKIKKDNTMDEKLNDILVEICETANVRWEEAQKFVDELQAEKKYEIHLYRSSKFAIVSAISFIFGIAILGYLIYSGSSGTLSGEDLENAESVLTAGITLTLVGIIGGLKNMKGIWEVIIKKFDIR